MNYRLYSIVYIDEKPISSHLSLQIVSSELGSKLGSNVVGSVSSFPTKLFMVPSLPFPLFCHSVRRHFTGRRSRETSKQTMYEPFTDRIPFPLKGKEGDGDWNPRGDGSGHAL